MAKIGEIYTPTRNIGKAWIRRYVFKRRRWYKRGTLGTGKTPVIVNYVKVRRCDLKKPLTGSLGYPVVGKIEEFEEVEFNKHHLLEE